MKKPVTLKKGVQIHSVNVIEGPEDIPEKTRQQIDELKKQLEEARRDQAAYKAEKEKLFRTEKALEAAAVEIADLQSRLGGQFSEGIAKLSVAIAEKIIMKEIEKKNYDIEKIIAEAVRNAPLQKDMEVHLHPGDCDYYKKNFGGGDGNSVGGLQVVADHSVGPGQCIVETERGSSQFDIQGALDKIEEALKGAAAE